MRGIARPSLGAFGLGVLGAGSALAQSVLQVPSGYPTIQAAIAAAATGDTVLVAPGTYSENPNYLGKAITVRSSDGAEVTTIQAGAPGSVVRFQTGEGRSSVLEGFTVKGGTSGGISCFSTAPTIVDCVVTGNTASLNGGGIAWTDIGFAPPPLGPALVRCRIAGNTTSGFAMTFVGGGGLHFNGAAFVTPATPAAISLTDCVIEGNTASMFGGGAVFRGVQVTLEGCVIRQNASFAPPRGAWFYDAPAVLKNCQVSEHAGTSGAIAVTANIPGLTFSLVNSTIAANGGGLSLSGAGLTAAIANSVLWSSGTPPLSLGSAMVSATFSDIQGGTGQPWFGAGCIDADPLFVDAGGGDFHLRFDSPCKDVASNSAPGLPAEDIEGDPRISGSAADMGADEFHPHLYTKGDPSPGSTLTIKAIGSPGTPALLVFGAGLLQPPIPTPFGVLHLQAPHFLVPMGLIGANGVLALPVPIPLGFPTPVTVGKQALLGLQLTNLCVVLID
jgi:hypothetical protein